MPILLSRKRKNPLDLNKNVEIGVAFPLNENNMFKGTETIREQAKSNILNVLLTYPGERINLPDFGLGIKKLLFEQSIDLESLKSKVQSQINRYVPHIRLNNVQTGKSEDEHTLFISLTYTYTLDNSEDTIQLNFR
jgi:phage baseplate assembly protein W